MKLTKNQIDQVVMPKFFEHAKTMGFTPSLEEYFAAKDTENPLMLYLSFQIEAIKASLYMTYTFTRGEIILSWTRQIGKTEVISHTESFNQKYFQYFTKEKYQAVVLAPEKNTGTVIFDRIIGHLPFGFYDRKKRGLIRENSKGDSLEIFSLYEDGGGSTYEGRTLRKVIRDESHIGDDFKHKDQVAPTLIRTSGHTVMIGNGGYKECMYYKSIKRGNTSESLKVGDKEVPYKTFVIRRDYQQIKDYMIDLSNKGVEECTAWVAGVEGEIRRSGINSIEVRKNIFCQWILTVEGFVSEDEIRKKVKKCKWDGKSPIFTSIDIAKHIDRTVVMFSTDKLEVFDLLILKDAQERKDVLEQFSILREYCDDHGYTEHMEMFGGDATGMGEVAIEILSQEFPCQIVEYKFTSQSKHKWYTGLQSRILTEIEEESIWFDEDLPMFEELIKEHTQLEVKPVANGNYLKFEAPQKKGYYDDIPAATAILQDLVSKYRGYIQNPELYENRFPTKKKNREPEYIEPENSPFKEESKEFLTTGY